MIAYFDMFSGVSGDMVLGSLIDAGLDPRDLRDALAGLRVPPFALRVKRVERGGFGCTLAGWSFRASARTRRLPEILELIGAAGFPREVKEKSSAIFHRLAQAEGRVHGVPPAHVHFHELGELDAILDICGAASALHLMGIERVEASGFRTGGGYVETAHGRLPVPAPAVGALLEGWRIEPLDVPAELTTPTGAAIVSALALPPGGPAGLVARRVGYGAGTRDRADPPNCLRVILGDAAPGSLPQETRRMALVETNIDDMNPQLYGWLEERLFRAGAREVYFTPVGMRKGRPGILVTCLCVEGSAGQLASVLFRETTTIGVRSWPVERWALARREEIVQTRLGSVRVKRVRGLDGREEVRPEHEECRRLAVQLDRPLRQVATLLSRELEGHARDR